MQLALEYHSATEAVSSGRSSLGRELGQLQSRYRRLLQEQNRVITDRTLNNYELEFHKKFSIPFACLTFVFFAFPVGLLTRRAGRAVGFGIGLLISTLYWSLLIAGQTLGVENPSVSPALAMWFPNALILVLGIMAYVWKVKR
jgi:lipopolysaccharide export system permease protein